MKRESEYIPKKKLTIVIEAVEKLCWENGRETFEREKEKVIELLHSLTEA